jgi:probable HAF family extracellular repeat protein
MATRNIRRGAVAAVSALVFAVVSPSLAAAQEEPVARGFTNGGQGYLLDDGKFRQIAKPGAAGTLPFGMNNRGHIVGIYDDADGRSHGFLWARGRFWTIDHPKGTGTTPEGISGSGAFDINDRGQIVGAYVDRDGHVRGYRWDWGWFRTIDAPGSTDTTAFSINNRGQMTIQSSTADEPLRSFLYDDGDFTRIEYPGADGTLVHKIGNDGEVVGVYGVGVSAQLGFTLNRGRYRSVAFPGTTLTGVNASNTRGTIVGYFLEGDLAQQNVDGAILQRGRLTTFDAPGPPDHATSVYDINDRGQMVGAKLPPMDIPAESTQPAMDGAPM